MERVFVHNLRSRDIAAQVNGEKRPLYEGRLLDRDIHISEFEVPVRQQLDWQIAERAAPAPAFRYRHEQHCEVPNA